MATHETSKGQGTGEHGIGLGVGVDLNVKLSGLRSALDELTTALKETGDKATSMITDAVRKIRDVGVESFKEMKGKEGEQGDIYHRTVENLQKAADRGEQEARDMLHKLGEGVEHTGQKMEGMAREGEHGEGTRH